MQKFASFKFEDAEKINKFLEKFPLASGTNIFMSDGKLLVQYEDGLPPTPAVQVIDLKEKILKFENNKADIEHSNRVMDTLIADAENRVAVAKAEVSRLEDAIEEATTAKDRTPLKAELEVAEKTVKERTAQAREARNQKMLNEHEIARLNLNIELFEERIATLEAN